MIALSVIVFFCLIRAILGPRFTDRIVAANMVSTKVIAFICLLSVFLREDFLIDVGIIYAMLGFVGVVVLSKIIQVREKAAKLKDMDRGTGRYPVILDATAGMGQDSLLLAAAGFEVEMYEQNPVIAALLADCLERAGQDPDLEEIVCRMHLHERDSIEALRNLKESPDVIYLDPMFPERQKSALVKKKFQLLHLLEMPCRDEEALFKAAVDARPFKLVVKRPLKGPKLAGITPGYSLTGKAIRYDCFVFPENESCHVNPSGNHSEEAQRPSC